MVDSSTIMGEIVIMAIRINDAVICGWIDNTTPGVTLGGIELLGLKREIPSDRPTRI